MNPVVRQLVLAYSVRNRHRKAALIADVMRDRNVDTVVLVGVAGPGGQRNEDIVEREIERRGRIIVAVNPELVRVPWPFVVGDGRALPLGDHVTDLVLSNAVIEHVGGVADQLRFVAEHQRVGRHWVMTTPNRWFPLESHTSTVFKHWSPTWRAGRPEFTRLLSRREFVALLPPGTVVVGRPWSATFLAFSPK